jgi:hypothetical protein
LELNKIIYNKIKHLILKKNSKKDLNYLLNNIKRNNMEDRIQINGEWYVKESTTYEVHQKELDLTYFEGFFI